MGRRAGAEQRDAVRVFSDGAPGSKISQDNQFGRRVESITPTFRWGRLFLAK